jgi:hypothetical protein
VRRGGGVRRNVVECGGVRVRKGAEGALIN